MSFQVLRRIIVLEETKIFSEEKENSSHVVSGVAEERFAESVQGADCVSRR